MARYGVTTHSVTATGSNDNTKQVSVNAWNADHDKSEAGMLGFTAETIASASSITPSNSTIILSGSTNVNDIAITNTNDKDLLYVFTSGTVTLVNTSSPGSNGQIRLLANANKDLSATVPTILIRVGNYWYEYGGGITNALNDIGDVNITSVADEDVLAYDSASSKWINQSADESGRVTASSTNTFTNKTIDADATGNSITNIEDANIKASAAIDASKIADGSVSDAEFQRLDGLTADIQTQLDGKPDLTDNNTWSGNNTFSGGTFSSAATTSTSITSPAIYLGDAASDTINVSGTLTFSADADVDLVDNSTSAMSFDATGKAGILNIVTTNSGEKVTMSGALDVTGTITGDVTGDLTGNADTVTTNANLTGDVTSVGNATTLATVTVAKGGTNLTSFSAGDILYATGATTLAKLAKGTASQTLTMNSGATAPEWATAASGSDTPWTEVHNFAGYYYDMTVQTKPANPSANNARFYVKEIDSNNDGLFCILRKNGSDTQEVQIV